MRDRKHELAAGVTLDVAVTACRVCRHALRRHYAYNGDAGHTFCDGLRGKCPCAGYVARTGVAALPLRLGL